MAMGQPSTLTNNTAPSVDRDENREPRSPAPPGKLWQVPLFCSGMICLAVVMWMRPLAGDPALRRLERDLFTVRTALERSGEEAGDALPAATRLLDAVESHPTRAAEIYYLAGSLQIRLAETAQGDNAESHWRKARDHFELADKVPQSEPESARVKYLLAKTAFYLQDPPEKVVEMLAAYADRADNPAEGYRLLSEAYLRLPEPDLERALSANEKLRMTPLLGEEVLAPARLQAGVLLMDLGRAEEARKILETVGNQAPPEVLEKARRLRARSYQEEEQWTRAAALWQAALPDTTEGSPERYRILYDLGRCYERIDQPGEAVRAWEQCLKQGQGEEAVAAAVGLAGYALDRDEHDRAFEYLCRSLEGVCKPEDWKNSLVDRKQVASVVTRAAKKWNEAGRFELVSKLGEVSTAVAPADQALRLKADALAAEAERAERKPSESSRPVAVIYQEASAAYQEVARSTADAEVRTDCLWKSAVCLGKAKKPQEQIKLLARFIESTRDSQLLGQGWYTLGETLQALKNPDAEKAYKECILTAASPYQYRARYHLARFLLERGDVDAAAAELDNNLKMLYRDPDREAQEKSFYLLAGLFYKRKNYQEVVRLLEIALRQYPENPDAARSRYQLADSYRLLAGQHQQAFINAEYQNPKTKEHYQTQHRELLQKAADEFLVLARFLETPEGSNLLTLEERVQVPFTAAECCFNLGQYEKALQIYQHLAQRYPSDRIEGLNAMGGLVRCYAALGQAERLRETLATVQEVLPTFPAEIRQPWSDWLRVASKPLQD